MPGEGLAAVSDEPVDRDVVGPVRRRPVVHEEAVLEAPVGPARRGHVVQRRPAVPLEDQVVALLDARCSC